MTAAGTVTPVCQAGWSAARRRLSCADGQRGSLTLFAAVFALGLLLMTGLVVDGGARLTAQARADHQAEQAARVAAQALDPASVRTGQAVLLDPARARSAALAYLAAAGYPDADAVVTVTGDRVDVRVTGRQPTAILGLIGRPSITVTGVGRALLVTGNYSQEAR